MSKIDATKKAFGDVKEIEGVSGHPDRYVDEDDEFRARVWLTFDEIANGAETISYIKFTRCGAGPHLLSLIFVTSVRGCWPSVPGTLRMRALPQLVETEEQVGWQRH